MKRVGKKEAKQIINNASAAFCKEIFSLSKEQTKAVLKHSTELNKTNCGWYEYWLKDALIKFCEDRLLDFKKPKKKQLA